MLTECLSSARDGLRFFTWVPHLQLITNPWRVRVSSSPLWMRTFKFRLRHSLSKSQVRPRPEHNTKILIKGRFADGDVEPSEPHSAGGQQAGSPFLCRASLSWLLTSGAHHLQPICSLWSKGFAILFLCFQVWADYSFTMRQSLREDPSLHLIAFFYSFVQR